MARVARVEEGAMDTSKRLELAGDAAVIIEEMGLGLTAVARLRDGVVTLECWGVARHRPVVIRHEVTDEGISAQALAEVCAAELRAVMTSEGFS